MNFLFPTFHLAGGNAVNATKRTRKYTKESNFRTTNISKYILTLLITRGLEGAQSTRGEGYISPPQNRPKMAKIAKF